MATPIPKGEGAGEKPKTGAEKPKAVPETRTSKKKLQELKAQTGLQQLQQEVKESPDSPEKKIAALKEWFKLNYKADVQLLDKVEHFGSGGTAYPVTDMAKAATEIEDIKVQLIKIPPEFLAKMGVKEFRIAGKMEEETQSGGKRALIGAAYPGNPVYLSSAWPLYHEFFHIMDGQFAGGMDGGPGPIDVSNWGLHKHSHGQNKAWADLIPDTKVEGNDYADFDEQQAMYCRLLFNLDDPEVRIEEYEKIILPDPGRMKKVEQMKKWLLEWSDGKFNEQYWRDLQDGKVVEGYWNKEKSDIRDLDILP